MTVGMLDHCNRSCALSTLHTGSFCLEIRLRGGAILLAMHHRVPVVLIVGIALDLVLCLLFVFVFAFVESDPRLSRFINLSGFSGLDKNGSRATARRLFCLLKRMPDSQHITSSECFGHSTGTVRERITAARMIG